MTWHDTGVSIKVISIPYALFHFFKEELRQTTSVIQYCNFLWICSDGFRRERPEISEKVAGCYSQNHNS